jgi:hypothetical protein
MCLEAADQADGIDGRVGGQCVGGERDPREVRLRFVKLPGKPAVGVTCCRVVQAVHEQARFAGDHHDTGRDAGPPLVGVHPGTREDANVSYLPDVPMTGERVRKRRRGEQLEAEIREAVFAELAEAGYRGLSM